MSLTTEMIEKIIPLSDRVLLKPIEADKITASGIILPDSVNKERPSLYEVVAVGPGKIDKNGNFVAGGNSKRGAGITCPKFCGVCQSRRFDLQNRGVRIYSRQNFSIIFKFQICQKIFSLVTKLASKCLPEWKKSLKPWFQQWDQKGET